MKCKCCEKEIDEQNSVNGVCLECNNENIKIEETSNQLENKNLYKNTNKNSDRSIIFLCISLILFNPLGIFSILAIIFGTLGLNDKNNTEIGRTTSITSIIGGILITLYKWFLTSKMALF